eukprot:9177436-Alexandrium_andersonii.AAC.1
MNAIRRLLQYKPRSSPVLCDAQGNVASTRDQAAQMWHEHFVRKLGAYDLEYGELVQDHVRYSADKMQ